MSTNHKKSESPVDRLKSESARQRWELFHRAIAHAKESNNASLLEADTQSADMDGGSVVLSIIQ